MSTIQEKFQQSQLADAAYADFAQYPDPQTALEKRGFSATQATAFVRQYRKIDQIPDTASGFSATVFEKLDANGNGTGQYILAPRGTNEFTADMLNADVKEIATSGVAYNQIVNMYNYWESLNTAAGSTYQAKQVQTLTTEEPKVPESIFSSTPSVSLQKQFYPGTLYLK